MKRYRNIKQIGVQILVDKKNKCHIEVKIVENYEEFSRG